MTKNANKNFVPIRINKSWSISSNFYKNKDILAVKFLMLSWTKGFKSTIKKFKISRNHSKSTISLPIKRMNLSSKKKISKKKIRFLFFLINQRESLFLNTIPTTRKPFTIFSQKNFRTITISEDLIKKVEDFYS